MYEQHTKQTRPPKQPCYTFWIGCDISTPGTRNTTRFLSVTGSIFATATNFLQRPLLKTRANPPRHNRQKNATAAFRGPKQNYKRTLSKYGVLPISRDEERKNKKKRNVPSIKTAIRERVQKITPRLKLRFILCSPSARPPCPPPVGTHADR